MKNKNIFFSSLLFFSPIAQADQQTVFIPLVTSDHPYHRTLSGLSGGGLSAHHLSGCQGWIHSQPDHVLVVTPSTHGLLSRSLVIGAALTSIHRGDNPDLTIVIRHRETGHVWCDDDGAGRLRPRVDVSWGVGTYDVYVGNFEQHQANHPYQLYIESRRPWDGRVELAGSLFHDMNHRFHAGSLLSPPFQKSSGQLMATGPLPMISRFCAGLLPASPTSHLQVDDPRWLEFRVQSAADTVIVIRHRTSGQIWCNDDTDGSLHPWLSFFAPTGLYDVYVGSIGTTSETYELLMKVD